MSPTVMGVFQGLKNSQGWEFAVKKGDAYEPFVKINALGDGAVLVTDVNGEVQNGDYVTSSMIPGYGQKQDDDVLRNHTVAKVIEQVDWSQVTEFVEYQGKRYKKALVACTYHGG
jgi:hypothetical protein